jgi:hypothetical protein
MMNPFKRKTATPPVVEMTVPQTTFLCEQGGIPEQDFKQSLIKSLSKRPHVQSAFLARVEYDNSEEFNMALCIRIEKKEDPSLKKEVGQIFTDLFKTNEPLDTMFLREEQAAEITKVCAPFYEI